MEKFRRNSFRKENIPVSDTGVTVLELLTIVGDNSLSRELIKLLNVDPIKDEFIKIKGAKSLVNIQKSINERYQKEDLKSGIDNISLFNSDDFSINFRDIKDNEYFENLNLSEIFSIPIYSATRDFFSELYQMDKYANKLIKDGHREIVEANLNMLKGIHKDVKRYRILHDKDDNLFYLRAIISLRNYFNYDNNVAVVVGLLTLHNEMKKSGIEYNMKLCEYNESFIRIFFESSEIKKLETIGRVKNLIEISNDEIKREALRFSGVCSIEFGDYDSPESELFIRSQEIKSRILSVKHNQIPKTAIQELANIDNARTVHENLYNEISTITKIKNPEQIKFLVKKKVENAKTNEVKRFKTQILTELNNSAATMIQLLTIFKKIELLALEDIEATDYLRFIFYQALIERK